MRKTGTPSEHSGSVSLTFLMSRGKSAKRRSYCSLYDCASLAVISSSHELVDDVALPMLTASALFEWFVRERWRGNVSGFRPRSSVGRSFVVVKIKGARFSFFASSTNFPPPPFLPSARSLSSLPWI